MELSLLSLFLECSQRSIGLSIQMQLSWGKFWQVQQSFQLVSSRAACACLSRVQPQPHSCQYASLIPWCAAGRR